MASSNHEYAEIMYIRWICMKNGQQLSILTKSMIVVLFMIVFPSILAYEPIPITISEKMNNVIFDGRWSFVTEWKQSSLNEYYQDETYVVLRSAHQGNFIYLLIDNVGEKTINSNLDKAMVCFDSNNDKTEVANTDDYCFLTILDTKEYYVYQGTGNASTEFVQISPPDNYIGIGSASDENDRYSVEPHTSYEFKIPIEIIDRKNIYGFYFAVYDDDMKTIYTYPENVTANQMFSSPSDWGELYSPDKSLPEFHLASLVMLFSLASTVLITRIKKLI